MDQAPHTSLAREPGDACCGIDVDGVESFAVTTFDVETDGVHGAEGAGQRFRNRGFVMHIGPDHLHARLVRLEERQCLLRVARDDPHAKAVLE